jgi:hypothetical protein
VFPRQSERQSFAPIQHNWQNYSFFIFLIFRFLYETGRQKLIKKSRNSPHFVEP